MSGNLQARIAQVSALLEQGKLEQARALVQRNVYEEGVEPKITRF